MKNVPQRIREITDNEELSNKQIVDALLVLDSENVDLGKGHSEDQKEEMRKHSRIIIGSIKPYDSEVYTLLKKGFDL